MKSKTKDQPFDDTAPIPTCRNFPRSWKSWRRLRPGERFRRGDRVVSYGCSWPLTLNIGGKVNRGTSPDGYRAGWYYRRVAR